VDIKPIDSAQQTPPPTPKDQSYSKADAGQHSASPAGVQDSVNVGSKSLLNSFNFMENMRAVSEEINAYAKIVRHTDAVLEKASNQVDLMKRPLEAIIKNFPPFPPGSEQRADLLKSFISLRKEIDKLTVPAPVDVATPALKQMFTDLFDKDGKFTGGEALGLPETLPRETTDRQIISVIDKLDTAKMQIDRGRVELSSSLR
jgi:hypothetical protein